jgi:hypothetical protein
MPFLAEKITSMLYSILKVCSPAELLEAVDQPSVVYAIEDAASA